MSYYFHWNKFKEKSDGISIEFFPTSSFGRTAKFVSLFSNKRSNNQQILSYVQYDDHNTPFCQNKFESPDKETKIIYI